MSDDPHGTQKLDAMQMLMAQLERIERSIETLPALLERIGALTESTNELEKTLRETSQELRENDAEQRREIQSLRLRQSEISACVAGLSSGLSETRNDVKDNRDRISNVTRMAESSAKLLEDGMTCPSLDAIDDELDTWRPWLAGLRWFLMIAGGILAVAIVGGILWAVVQSGSLGAM